MDHHTPWKRTVGKHLLWALASGAMVLVSTLVRLVFLGGLGDLALFTTFYPAVILASLFFGPVAGVWTVVFSLATIDLFLMDPVGSLAARSPQDVLGLVVFGVNGALICTMTMVYHRHRDRVKQLEEESLLHQESRKAGQTIALLNRRLNLAIQAGRFGVWDWDVVGDVLVWDDRMYELYGVTKTEFTGAVSAWLAGVHPEDRAECDRVYRRFVAGEGDYDTEFRVVWPDGSVHRLRARAIAERDSGGRAVRLIGVNEDVTEARAAEEALMASERRFRRAIEEAPFPIMVHAEDGQVVAVSRRWTELTGYRLEDIPTIEEWTRRAYGEGRQPVLDEIETLYHLDRRKDEGEYPVVCSDGTRRIWEFSSVSLEPLPDGRRVAMSMAFDVTARKQVETALAENEFFFRESQKAAAIGSYMTDFVAGQWKSSEVLDGIFGIDSSYRRDIPGWLDLVHPDDQTMMERYLREEVILKRRPFLKEYRIVRPSDGQTRWVLGRGETSFSPEGSILSLFGTIQDITDAKKDEQERAYLQAQLVQSQKMENLGSLAGGIAHDMNNVLAAILSLASVKLVTMPETDPHRRSFERIAKAAERGGEMVQRLLSFARKGQVEERPLDLNALILEELALLERTTSAQVRFEIDLDPRLRSILGDPGALSHALMNLCINSFDAMDGAGTLTIRTRNRDPGQVELEVTDTGTGMPPEVLARAIDPFFTTKPTGKGTGLGLSLVYSTVQAHHGRMVIHSEPGLGTTVALTFPEHSSPASLPSAEDRCRDSSVTTLKVLLVDDDDLVRGALRETLEVLCHQVTEVSSGAAALDAVEQGPHPDLMVLDMNMPGLGGAQTLSRLRRLAPDLPVLLATGRADQAALDLVEGNSRVVLISKPFTVKELSEKLTVLMG